MSKQAKELRKLNKEELAKRLTETELQLMKDRGQVASGTAPKQSSAIRNARKTVARIYTIQNE